LRSVRDVTRHRTHDSRYLSCIPTRVWTRAPLIHGVGANSAVWEPVHAKLAQRFTVIAPDLLGHGESDKPNADYSLPAFANGMRDLLAALGIDRVTVVGHSYGGGVAMQFAY
jgi:pimeloyl-ACP methyl ester carboxylesterase